MKDHKAVRWLLKELPGLERAGIIDAASKERLEQFYRKELDSASETQNYFLWGMLAVGTLMVSGGIILLTAHNWDMLPKVWKIAISFAPFAISSGFGIFTLVKGSKQEFREVSALLISGSIAGLIALVSQIYHTGGSMFDFLTLALGLSLPLLYVFNSVLLGTVFPFFLLFYSAVLSSGNPVWFPFVYTLLWLPFAVRHLWELDSPKATAMRYAVLAGAAALIVQYSSSPGSVSDLLLPLFCMAAVCFMNAGLDLHDGRKGRFGNPWLVLAYGFISVLLVVWSCAGGIFKYPDIETAGVFFQIVWGVFVAGALFSLLIRFSFEKLFISLFALFPFAGPVISPGKSDVLPASIYLGCFGGILILCGFRRGDLLRLNLGLLQLIALIACRFFNENYSILVRSAVFIGLGVIFLLANVILGCYFRSHKLQKGVEP